ncbi:MAG: hypothetical protein JJE52_12930 [Acidimicrobiia bacterium]|nr:hypothetical protein [Acidimicrobiia bacterium]
MTKARIPVLLLVVAALVLALVVERTDSTEDRSDSAAVDLRRLAPSAAGADALGSTWYCAAGSAGGVEIEPANRPDDVLDGDGETTEDADGEATEPDGADAEDEATDSTDGEATDTDETEAGDGAVDPDGAAAPPVPVVAEHTVVLTNAGDADRVATLTIHPGQDAPVVSEVEVPARSVERIDLADLAEGPAVAALVELDGGAVVVTHHVVGPLGRDSGPCSSVSSDVWHFAWGDTSRGSASLVALFNPFPGDAVVDFSFVTSDGVREPQALTGMVVPAGSVIVADVGAEVRRREHVSTTVSTRTGRVVAERIQAFDGTDEAGRSGLAIDLGVPEPASTWMHVVGRRHDDLPQTLVVYNPSDTPAEVDVEIALPDDVVGAVAPFELTVGPGDHATLDLTDQARLLDVFGEDFGEFAVTVRSLNGVAVVTELATFDTSAGGVSISSGSPLMSRQVVVADPAIGEPGTIRLRIVNLDDVEATDITIQHFADGEVSIVDGGSIVIDPAGRAVVDLDDLDVGPGSLLVTSSAPIVAEVVAVGDDPADLSVIAAVPFGSTPELLPTVDIR